MIWLWCNAHVHLLSVHHAFIHLHAHTHVPTMHRNNKLAQFNALPFSLPITTPNLFLSLFFMYSSPVANLLRSALKWQDSKASTIQHTTGIVPLHYTTVKQWYTHSLVFFSFIHLTALLNIVYFYLVAFICVACFFAIHISLWARDGRRGEREVMW